MSGKKGRSLADMIMSLDDEAPASAAAEKPPAPAPVPAQDRAKIVAVNILVTPDDRRRLRQLSLDTGLSVQKLGHEALNMLLEARGLRPLEPVTANVPSGRSRR